MRFIFVSLALMIFSLLRTEAQTANPLTYLDSIIVELQTQWPKNRTVNLVFHGHSVPSGYFKNHYVRPFDSYPHLVYQGVKEKYPYAVVNVITTSIGGENSKSGAARFEKDVLNHKPDVLFIDYALNDRRMTLDESDTAWSFMIEKALKSGIKVILLTPTADTSAKMKDSKDPLYQHAAQVRELAKKYNVGMVDSYTLFLDYVNKGGQLTDLMSQINHPNRKGHEMVANEILKWFLR